MEFSLMGRCHPTKLSEAAMMLSILSSLKLVLANMFPELFSLIWSQQLSTKFEQEHTDNYSIPNS
jgi:3-methyladenine DNA glycosylase/8-oxoguanine DNA glycosylase